MKILIIQIFIGGIDEDNVVTAKSGNPVGLLTEDNLKQKSWMKNKIKQLMKEKGLLIG